MTDETNMGDASPKMDNFVEPEELVVVDAIPLARTQIRQAFTPYLPPPMVVAMNRIDPLLQPYVGPEPSITIASTLLLSLVLWQILKLLSHVASGRAIAEDDEEEQERKMVDKDFRGTLLLCGPTGAGKTRLFYGLCHGRSKVSTLTSIKMNVDVSPDGIRFMDYPGHRTALAELLESLMKESNDKLCIILTLDATQPVPPAADIMYQILHTADSYPQRISVYVACNKSDLPNSKNWKRIRIQLRTELERMLKLASSSSTTMDGDTKQNGDKLWWPPGKPLDMDHNGSLSLAHLEFGSVSCETGSGMDELRVYSKGEVSESKQS